MHRRKPTPPQVLVSRYDSVRLTSKAANVQVFVKGFNGRSVGVDVDLDDCVSTLSLAFSSVEGIPIGSRAELSWRFIYAGRLLQEGLPLRCYGVVGGSNIHLTAVLPSQSCVRLPFTIRTAFAEAEGTFELPATQWTSCTLTADVLQKLHRRTDLMGSTLSPQTTSTSSSSKAAKDAALKPSGCASTWVLRLRSFRPFPGIGPDSLDDMWDRLSHMKARIKIVDTVSEPDAPVDAMTLGQYGIAYASSAFKVSISLLSTEEEMLEDSIDGLYVNSACLFSGDVCCVCLDPMQVGEKVSRLPCEHCLHVGCAMAVLTRDARCPLCRQRVHQKGTESIIHAAIFGARWHAGRRTDSESSDTYEEDSDDPPVSVGGSASEDDIQNSFSEDFMLNDDFDF